MKHQSADIEGKWQPTLNRVQIIVWVSEHESLTGLFAKAL